MLVATTNEIDILDKAMLARFQVVQFPRWEELTDGERRSFAKSHGHEDAHVAGSYAEVVQRARAVRVQRIISEAKAARGEQ
jgi:hypothetical protein